MNVRKNEKIDFLFSITPITVNKIIIKKQLISPVTNSTIY